MHLKIRLRTGNMSEYRCKVTVCEAWPCRQYLLSDCNFTAIKFFSVLLKCLLTFYVHRSLSFVFIQTDCFNYIKILLRLNSTHLYVCGTYAFSPVCAYIVSIDLSVWPLFTSRSEHICRIAKKTKKKLFPPFTIARLKLDIFFKDKFSPVYPLSPCWIFVHIKVHPAEVQKLPERKKWIYQVWQEWRWLSEDMTSTFTVSASAKLGGRSAFKQEGINLLALTSKWRENTAWLGLEMTWQDIGPWTGIPTPSMSFLGLQKHSTKPCVSPSNHF